MFNHLCQNTQKYSIDTLTNHSNTTWFYCHQSNKEQNYLILFHCDLRTCLSFIYHSFTHSFRTSFFSYSITINKCSQCSMHCRITEVCKGKCGLMFLRQELMSLCRRQMDKQIITVRHGVIIELCTKQDKGIRKKTF